MTRYLIVVEAAGDSFSAYVPDVPGCYSAGTSVEEAIHNMREALALHLDGDPWPEAVTHLGSPLALDAAAVATVEVDLQAPPMVLKRT